MSSENNVYAMPSAERRAARKASLPSMSGRLAVVRQMTWGEFKKQACQSSRGWRKTLGELGEEVVVELLERQGWRILERNWRAGRYAEIDLVALDSSGLLVFAEVKTRCGPALTSGFPEGGFESMTAAKQKKICTAAMIYLARSRVRSAGKPCRIDLLIVSFDRGDMDPRSSVKDPQVIHVQNAFRPDF